MHASKAWIAALSSTILLDTLSLHVPWMCLRQNKWRASRCLFCWECRVQDSLPLRRVLITHALYTWTLMCSIVFCWTRLSCSPVRWLLPFQFVSRFHRTQECELAYCLEFPAMDSCDGVFIHILFHHLCVTLVLMVSPNFLRMLTGSVMRYWSSSVKWVTMAAVSHTLFLNLGLGQAW